MLTDLLASLVQHCSMTLHDKGTTLFLSCKENKRYIQYRKCSMTVSVNFSLPCTLPFEGKGKYVTRILNIVLILWPTFYLLEYFSIQENKKKNRLHLYEHPIFNLAVGVSLSPVTMSCSSQSYPASDVILLNVRVAENMNDVHLLCRSRILLENCFYKIYVHFYVFALVFLTGICKCSRMNALWPCLSLTLGPC